MGSGIFSLITFFLGAALQFPLFFLTSHAKFLSTAGSSPSWRSYYLGSSGLIVVSEQSTASPPRGR
eukprot:12888960-Prorocentrum_lima.AAC.1